MEVLVDFGGDGARLAETAGLTLGLEEAEDVVLTDCKRGCMSVDVVRRCEGVMFRCALK